LESQLKAEAAVRKLEAAQPQEAVPIKDWPHAVGEYVRRFVSLTVCYDGGFESRSLKGKELYLTVAFGCFVGKDCVLTCAEALEMAMRVAEYKHGQIKLLADYIWYDFEPEDVDKASGLVCCRVTGRDEERLREAKELGQEYGLKDLVAEPVQTEIKFTVTPWLGQEVGFLHAGEAPDISGWPKLQFDATVVSHFRVALGWAIKSFVTGVLPGRILRVGAPVFTRDGTLVGVIADTESYSSDAGRRARVKSLLGHPRFTKFIRKS